VAREPQFNNDSKSRGWFKTNRNEEVAFELYRLNPHAFMILFAIALRARYSDGFNADGLQPGEAMLGDYGKLGMTEQEYRTAKQQLQKFGFATFRSTPRGTIGKLTDTRLFDPLNISNNGQNNAQPTGKQRTNNGQTTDKQRLTRR
jgi:hypothetical protein